MEEIEWPLLEARLINKIAQQSTLLYRARLGTKLRNKAVEPSIFIVLEEHTEKFWTRHQRAVR